MSETPGQAGGAEQRIEITIAAGDAGIRLDRALQHLLPELSRTRQKPLLRDGRVATPGGVVRAPAQRAIPGIRIAVPPPAPDEPSPAAQAIPLDIRFEDSHLIVIDKPAGMVVHPAPGNPAGTLVNALLAHCGPSLAGIGGGGGPPHVPRPAKDPPRPPPAPHTPTAPPALSHPVFARARAHPHTA